MRHLKEIKRPRLATILAGLALMVALGGSATAASGLINGKKIKNNSVPGKKLKNRTVTPNKLAPKTIKTLRGKRGPQGAQGPQGQQGPKGAPGENGADGKDGIVAPAYAEFGNLNLPANTELAIGATNVPAGKYLITATFRTYSNGTANMGCYVNTNAGGGSSETATWSSPAPGSRTTLPAQMVTESSSVTQVTLACHPGNAAGSAAGNVIITPVQPAG